MVLNLPVAGETPWDAKLNAAITGIDADLQAFKALPPITGPAGPPGTAYLNAAWNFNQNTAVSPASGTMRMNGTTYAAVTYLWVHETDRDGLSRVAGLDVAVPGDQIIMQSAQGRAVWDITGQADSGTYRTFTVTLVESSGSRPSASSPTTLYFATAGGTSGTILSGTATPTAGTGAVGDYYLDTDDHTLYGPKAVSAGGGGLQYIETDNPSLISVGGAFSVKHQFLKAGIVKGVRFKVGSNANATFKARLYSAAGALLASKDAPSVTLNAWNTVLFDTPVAVSANTTYLPTVYIFYAEHLFYGSTAGGQTVGDVRIMSDAETSNLAAVYSGGDGFPNLGMAVPTVGVAAVFEVPATDPWPVALKSVPPGGTTGQVLKKTSGADYAVGWVT